MISLGPFGEFYKLLACRRDAQAAGWAAIVNACVGALLIVVAALMTHGDLRGSPIELGTVATIGVAMLLGTLTVAIRPDAAFSALTAQAILLILFSALFTFQSLRWALQDDPGRSFRYVPTMFLLPWAFGFRELAAFGPWSRRASLLRRIGIGLGLVTEFVFAACALFRLSR